MSDAIDPQRLPPRITSHEYAALARVKIRTVWAWHADRKGPQPVAKAGARLLWDRDEVLRHLGFDPSAIRG